jgi:hypothetical protein
MRAKLHTLAPCLVLLPIALGCSSSARSGAGEWTGSIDTLPSGRVVVTNTDERYLGEERLPFRIARPYPVIRGSTMWAVTTDSLEVPFVVRARVIKPPNTTM